jgi:hypothetical protein
MTNSDYHVCDRGRAWCGLTGTPFYRLNPNLEKQFPLDETKDDILVDAMWETMVYMHRNREEVKAIAALLKDGPEAALSLPSGGMPPTMPHPPTKQKQRRSLRATDPNAVSIQVLAELNLLSLAVCLILFQLL